ncbi:hypothetical protein J8J21_21765, partial [Mycobacterium tuberculosis]
TSAPALFQPKTGPLGLTDWEKVYAAGPSKWTEADIFEARELSRDGVVIAQLNRGHLVRRHDLRPRVRSQHPWRLPRPCLKAHTDV